MAEPLTFIDGRLDDSITSLTPPTHPIDNDKPLTFIQWLQRNTQVFTSTDKFLNRYQLYLNNWYEAKGMSREDAARGVQQYYLDLINNVIINYTSNDEQRYLLNLDLSNSRDLAIAVPFFAKKIKNICLYYSELREDAKTAAVQYNLKGSNVGIETLLYSSFAKATESHDVATTLTTYKTSLSSILNNLVIEVEDVYDTYPDYRDVSTLLPSSAYNITTGLRKDYFELNQVDIDPNLFTNINQSIVRAILSYPFYLAELGDNFTIDPLVDSSQLTLLKDSDFISTINDGQRTNLNLQTQASITKKYAGSDFYYITTSATSTGTTYASGQLFTADNVYAHYLNRRYPSIAAVPSEEFFKTGKELGLFFKPDKIGLVNFTNFDFTPQVNIDKLQPGTLYYFPDPQKYGNVSGNTKVDFTTPFIFSENNYFNKIDFSNQYSAGEVLSDPYLQTFRAYQSREQSLNTSEFGLSRYTDSQSFFTGDLNDIWSNPDIYTLSPINRYPIEQRIGTLLTFNDKTLFQYKTDIYGNEYGLYKTGTGKQFTITPKISSAIDFILDGYTFKDTLCGQDYDFNYSIASGPIYTNLPELNGTYINFSGVTLRTSVAPNTFEDDNDAIVLESYDFISNAGYVFDNLGTIADSTYNCSIKDGFTFVKQTGAPLPDIPSDDPNFNPTSSIFYYNELADGAVNYEAPYRISTASYPGSFLINPNTYTGITEYDGSAFIDITNQEPCPRCPYFVVTEPYSYSYAEPSNFKDLRLNNKDTIVDLSLSALKTVPNTLYKTRTAEYGSFYFRNNNSTQISPVSSALSGLLINFTTEAADEIKNKLINFDIYYDIIQFETENYLVFQKISFDHDTSHIIGAQTNNNVFNRNTLPAFEKFSSVWFDEHDNMLTFCKTTLLTDSSSATNYKVIYPIIYRIDLSNNHATQIYPKKNTSDLQFSDLQVFSLFGAGVEIDIIKIEKPVLNYSDDTGYYTLTYLAKDAANCFYIVTNRFQYINNEIANIACTLHKPTTDTYHVNFQNYRDTDLNPSVGPYFDTFAVIGNNTGFVDKTQSLFTYTFGNGQIGDITAYDADAWEYILRAGVSDVRSRQAINDFVTGIKRNLGLGFWNNIICWPMISDQNAGVGTTIYPLGGMTQGSSATIYGEYAWTVNGVRLVGNSGDQNSGRINSNNSDFAYKHMLSYVVAQAPTADEGSIQQLMTASGPSLSGRWVWIIPNNGNGVSEYDFINTTTTLTANSSTNFNSYGVIGSNYKTALVYQNGSIISTTDTVADITTVPATTTGNLMFGTYSDDPFARGGYFGNIAFALVYRSNTASLYPNTPETATNTIKELDTLYKTTLGANLTF